jgi:hypothetical protein
LASSLPLNLRRHALPLAAAVSIVVGSMVALPSVAMASFVNDLTYQGQHGSEHAKAIGKTGTVAGTVQLLACGGPPPMGPPRPCIFRPMAGAQVDLDAGGRTVTSAITDVNGHYSARVPAGIYTVRVVLPQSLALLGASQTVRVVRHELEEADFQLTFQAA